MPSIDVAMARSLRGGLNEVLARSLRHAFVERDVVTDAEDNITDVTTAFSSWSNCMEAVYCKWPVIAVIIIGGLIILSIVWCIARCLCCGLSCCCECCHCLKCCGNCCGCCDAPRGGRRKHLDEPYKNIPDDQGYQPHDPMSTGAMPWQRPTPTAKAEPPQYASFDVSKNAPESEDSLPAMPTWGDAENKKVDYQQEAMELQQLKKPENNDLNASPNAPLMNGMSRSGTPGTMTPVQGGVSPYGPPGGMPVANGYMSAAGPHGANMYSQNNLHNMSGHGGYDQMHNGMPNGYAQSTTSFHTEQSYGVMSGGPMISEYGQPHPQMGYGQDEYGQGVDGYGGRDQHDPNQATTAATNQPYGGRAPPMRSMTGGSTRSAATMAYPDRSRRSPAPSQGGFSSERNFDSRIAPPRTYSPAPQQQGQGQFPNVPERTFSPGVQGPTRTFSPAQGAPPRTYSPAQGAPPRTFSPAQGAPPRNFSPAPSQRQWSADSAPGRGPPPRAPPYRQYSADTAQPNAPMDRQFTPESVRSMGNRPPPLANRAPPQRQYTADIPPGPVSPNFSRPTRSNTFDDSYGASSGQEDPAIAYPGYKPYQPTR
ncbi:hypothetical protein BD289DRAFT_90811 [Coniella lustricola]|uniref:Fibroin-3 related protein n=1 Tax=Coniella lustricola TaxID=2025994 RepID=A0A2T3AH00_9PEZI|nr:hypothetical protein BD289DRAFT_90811 [Coniella lustricola]